MFRMIGFFFSCWNPFDTLKFPYCLYSWFLPFCYMIQDIFHWISKGYPKCFTWDVDHSIAHFALPLLKTVRNEKEGTPGKVFNDFNLGDNYDQAHKEWIIILNKIIYALEGIVNCTPEEIFIKHYQQNFNLASKLKREEQEKIDEGLELLGKYFTCLWT